MSGVQAFTLAYLGAGLVRSVSRTKHLRSLVEQPAGGLPRLVAVYLLCAILWLPLDALFAVHAWLVATEGR